jgi:hypothetical protein
MELERADVGASFDLGSFPFGYFTYDMFCYVHTPHKGKGVSGY